MSNTFVICLSIIMLCNLAIMASFFLRSNTYTINKIELDTEQKKGKLNNDNN